MTQGMIDAKTRPGGRIGWTVDAAANDSDKTFTVPAGKIWEMRGIYIKATQTATVGNRIYVVNISPDGATPIQVLTGVAAVASGTVYYQVSFNSVTDDWVTAGFTSVIGSFPMLLPAAATIRVYDASAIDPAADDMTVILHYIEYDA